MSERVDDGLIARYLSGECGAADTARVERWMADHPDNRAAVEALRRVWNAGAVRDVPQFDPDGALWRRIAARMTSDTKPRLVSTPSVGVRGVRSLALRRRAWTASIAASLLAAGAVFLVALHEYRRPDRRGALAGRPPVSVLGSRLSGPAQPIDYVTGRGQVTTIRLTDGSRIILAPETKLRVPHAVNEGVDSNGSGAPRVVTLQGEAYFEVVHNERRPFVVRTALGVVRDIGTAFSVRAYERARGMKVSVVSGAVVLQRIALATSSPNDSILPVIDATTVATLKRSDQATLLPTGTVTLAHGVDMRSTVAWTKGRLVFDGAPLRDVVVELSRWYDLDVRLADSTIGDRHLALEVSDQPAAAVLNLVALSLNLRVERKDHGIILHRAD